MKKLSLLSLMTCLVLLSGCSSLKFWDSDSDGDAVEIEPAALVDFQSSVAIDELWSSGGVGNIGVGTGRLKPAIGNGAIYAADDSGRVVALNQNTGDTLWKTDLDAPLTGGVGYGAHQVLVGSVEGELFVLSADSGAVLWKTAASSEILAAPASNGEVVVVQTQNGRLQAFNAETGDETWQFEVDVPILTIRGTSSPLMTSTMVMAAFSNGKIYGLKADSGLTLWEARVAVPTGRTELERIVDIDGDMLLNDDILYAASFQGRLGAFARGTGRALWYQDVSSHQAPGYGLSQVYTTDENDVVRAYRANSGQPLWSNDQMLYRDLTSSVVVGGFVAVADSDGYLHLLSQTDGSYVGRDKVDGSGVSANMLVSDDVLYVLDNGGSITAYRVD